VVVNLTRALALDLGKKGIRIFGVLMTRTGMTEDMLKDNKLVAKFEERTPLAMCANPRSGGGHRTSPVMMRASSQALASESTLACPHRQPERQRMKPKSSH
jgi:NAD(P)-dependent dehydrogenase (short-subunit alcohol dehydrogenase family)